MKKKNISELQLPQRFEGKLLKDLEYLRAYDNLEIEEIILFGSCARGTYKITSDIDILLITKESISRQVRGDIASELDEERDGVRTDVVFYSRAIFEESNTLLTKQIKQDGIILYSTIEDN